jgi:hypothetical protein
MEPKLPVSDQEHTREISSSPENSGIGIAARAHACSFTGSDGCFAALFGLAGQRHSFPAGNHPFALEFEKRRLNLSPRQLL